MSDYQIGKDIQSIQHRLDALERSACDGCDCDGEGGEHDFALTPGMISVRAFPMSESAYVLVIRVQEQSPLAQFVRPSVRVPTLDRVVGGERVLVAIGSAESPVKPSDFISPEALVNGRGYYKRRGNNGRCRSYDHNENCVDCQAYLNRLYDRSSGFCGYFGYCVSPPTCFDDPTTQK